MFKSSSSSNTAFTTKQRRRLYCILLPGESGKTVLCDELSKYRSKNAKDKSYKFIDVDRFATLKVDDMNNVAKKSVFDKDQLIKEAVVFPQIKDNIVKLLNHFVNNRIVIVTSSESLVEFLDIKSKRLNVYVPTSELWIDIKSKLNYDTSNLDNIRDNIIRNFGKKLQQYNSLKGLVETVVDQYDLVGSL
jgi:hypothetical protein